MVLKLDLQLFSWESLLERVRVVTVRRLLTQLALLKAPDVVLGLAAVGLPLEVCAFSVAIHSTKEESVGILGCLELHVHGRAHDTLLLMQTLYDSTAPLRLELRQHEPR